MIWGCCCPHRSWILAASPSNATGKWWHWAERSFVFLQGQSAEETLAKAVN